MAATVRTDENAVRLGLLSTSRKFKDGGTSGDESGEISMGQDGLGDPERSPLLLKSYTNSARSELKTSDTYLAPRSLN